MYHAWIKNLNEVGTPILKKVERLDHLKAEIDRLEVEYKTQLDDLVSEVKEEWSDSEIRKAIRKTQK